MTKEEFTDAMDYLFAGYEEPGKMLRLKFWDQFKGIEFKEFQNAIRIVAKQRFTPTVADVWNAISVCRREAQGLISGTPIAELVTYCEYLANKAVPPIPGHQQFSSPEELSKAQHWNTIQRQRKFDEIYEAKETRLTQLIDNGTPLTQAVQTIVAADGNASLGFASQIALKVASKLSIGTEAAE